MTRNPHRATLLVLALLAAVLLAPSQGSRLLSASGDVEIGRGEPPSFDAAQPGEAIAPGDVVRTGDDGRAEVELGRATVRLYPNSLLRVPEAEDAVELERGRSLFDVLHGDDFFEVRTPEVVVSVKGTRFSIALADAGAAVAVFRGLVGVRALAADAAVETLVREGFMAAGRDRFDLSLHGRDDPWEAWGSRALPLLPEPELRRLPAPAEAAVRQARSAALESARRDAVRQAAERHPEVAAELARVREDVRRRGKGAPEGNEIDAVGDRRRPKLERALEESYVESFLNAPPPGGGAGGTQLDVSFIDGSGGPGGDRVRVEANALLSWEFDKNDLEDVLDGSATLPSALTTILGANGVTEQQFADGAMMLLEN